jgi:hypothetical protein
MKARRFLSVLALTLVFVVVLAAPAMAGKAPTFTSQLASDGGTVPGDVSHGFTLNLGGVAGVLHDLTLVNPVASPTLVDGMYPFYLKASTSQKAKLVAYFTAKGWPQPYLDQIIAQINGTSPFFFVNAAGGVCTLVDGFSWAMFGTTPTLRIDDDYPVGNYLYSGRLFGSSRPAQQVCLKVIR